MILRILSILKIFQCTPQKDRWYYVYEIRMGGLKDTIHFYKEMGGAMNNSNSKNASLKLIEKIHYRLKEIETLCADYETKEKLCGLLNYIEDELTSDKKAFAELIYEKVKETKGSYSELNTRYYLLYRNLVENKISIQEARNAYEIYEKELVIRKNYDY